MMHIKTHYKSWSRRILVVLIMACVVPVNVMMPVRAQESFTDTDIYAILHHTTYYQPCSSGGGGNNKAGGTLSNDSKMYILGDSITAGVAEAYKKLFPNATISARVGRSWTTPGQDGGGTGTQGTGENAFNTDQQAVKDAKGIIIALGTNGTSSLNPVDTILEKFKGANSSAPIFWVNVATSKVSGVPEFNAKLKATADSGKIKLIDWAGLVDPGGDGTHNPAKLLGGDEIHPNSDGQAALVKLVAGAVSGGSGGASADKPSSYLPGTQKKNIFARISSFFVAKVGAQEAPKTDPNATPTTPSNGASATANALTNLRDQIAQLLFVRADNKQQANEAVGTHHVGGVFVTNEYGTEMLDPNNIKEAKSKFSPAPFFGADEEGGKVDRLGILKVNAKQMGAMQTDEVKKLANEAGTKMKSTGIDVDFAPVADVDNPQSDAIGKLDRSFGADPNTVVEKAGAFAEGLKAGGVIPTFKHFPGIGNTTVNSDVSVGATPALDQLKNSDLKPYEKLATTPGAWIMMSNYSVPGLTNGQAASISKPAYDLLRNDYKFNGIIITDDLAAGSLGPVSKYVANPDVVVNAIKAGTDIALFGGETQLKTIIDKLEAAANADPALKAQIQASANKVMAAKSGQTPAKGDGSACCAAGGGSAVQLAGTDNIQKVWNFFATKEGYKEPYKIAGILGNMQAESGVNPRRVEGTVTPAGDSDTTDSRGYGLVQFTPGTKILPDLERYNKEHNTSVLPGDLAFQLDLLWRQLEGNSALNEKAAGDHLKQTTDVQSATHVFLKEYERAGVEREQVRQDFASKILQDFGSGAGAVSGSPTESNSGSCDNGNGNSALSGEIGNRIVEVAKRELAAHGNQCPTGSDCQKTYSDGAVEAWCADFVSWVLKEAGSPYTGGTSGGWRQPSVSGSRAWFEKNAEFHLKAGYTPKPGDIQINQNNDPTYPDHVAIVVAVNGNMATIIGGNDGSNLKTSQQPIDASWVTGYGTKTK
jgi:beta-N-acetylhexosaminidase